MNVVKHGRRRIVFRWIRRAVICLLLGAIINVAVAVWFASRGKPKQPLRQTPLPEYDWFESKNGDATGIIYVLDRGQEFICLHHADLHNYWMGDLYCGKSIDSWGDMYRILPSWSVARNGYPEWFHLRPDSTPLIYRFDEQAAGWPCMSLHGSRRFYAVLGDGLYVDLNGLVEWPFDKNEVMYEGTYIPIRAIPSGFALNTLFYSFSMSLLWFVAFDMRRFIRWNRRRRWICEKCKYPRRTESLNCPECGTAYPVAN